MAKTKGADLIADYLIQEGMPYVFGICGHGNVVDGLLRLNSLVRTDERTEVQRGQRVHE